MNNFVHEIVSYHVLEKNLEKFRKVHVSLIHEMKKVNSNLLEVKQYRSISPKGRITDIWTYKNFESAQKGYSSFKSCKSCAEFMSLINRVNYQDHLEMSFSQNFKLSD